MTLPNFLIIGAHKAGTTSLYHYLKQHPDIFMPADLKEARFFAYDNDNSNHRSKVPTVFPITTFDDYKALFINAGNAKAIGEASPEYLNSTFAADKIKQYIPNAKLIVSLRNPVDRAYSLYQMSYRGGGERRSINEAFKNTDERWITTGLYYNKLQVYINRFSKDQLKIVLFDDLTASPEKVLGDIFNYLEVKADYMPNTTIQHNPGGIPKNKILHKLMQNKEAKRIAKSILSPSILNTIKLVKYGNLSPAPKLTSAIRERMIEYYYDDILKLQELIKRDLSVWLK